SAIVPAAFRTSRDLRETVAIPAESYPRYSSRRRPGRMKESASRWPTYPTIPHMLRRSLLEAAAHRRDQFEGPLRPGEVIVAELGEVSPCRDSRWACAL